MAAWVARPHRSVPARDKRECLRRRAEPRLADRVVLTGTICREGDGEAPFEALYPAAAPRAYRGIFPTASEHRCAVASSRRCLFARQRTSAAASARHRGEKIYWSA